MDFAHADIGPSLDTLDSEALEGLEFGVVRMSLDGRVDAYNGYESKLSGLSPSRVIGKHFFSEVAPCTNNVLVASRYEEGSLDEELPYVFTLRMKPRKVMLRLVKRDGSKWQYLLVRDQ